MAGFGLLLFGIIEAPNRAWTSPMILGALAGAAAIIAAFIVWERHTSHPMLPLHFFRNRRYTVAISALAMVLFALLGMFFLITQYLQFALGYSPLRTGLSIAPVAAILLVIAPLSAILARRFGTKPLVGGGLLTLLTSRRPLGTRAITGRSVTSCQGPSSSTKPSFGGTTASEPAASGGP